MTLEVLDNLDLSFTGNKHNLELSSNTKSAGDVFLLNFFIMVYIHSLLIQCWSLLDSQTKLINLIYIIKPNFFCCIPIEIQFLKCLECPMLKFNVQVNCFSKHHLIWVHTNRCFKSYLYANTTSSNFLAWSVWWAFTALAKIVFISLLDTSTCPLVCGRYGVATLCCFTPYLVKKNTKHFVAKKPSKNVISESGNTSLSQLQ